MATDQRTEPNLDDLEKSYHQPTVDHPLGSREGNVYDDDHPVASGADLRAAEESGMGVKPEGHDESSAPTLDSREKGGRDYRPKFDWMDGGFYKKDLEDKGPGKSRASKKFWGQKVGGKKNAGGFLSRHKKELFLAGGIGGGAIGFFAIMVMLILILAPYKTVHFATILRSVGMARFTYVMNKQFSRTIFDSAVLTKNSTGRFVPPQSSLFYKVVGINPAKQLKQLGNDNVLRFDFEGSNIWGGALGRTNTFRGVVINGQGYYIDDYARNMYGVGNYDDLSRAQARKVRASFSTDVQGRLSDALQLKSRRFRWGVYKGFYQATGIRLVKWFNKAKDYENLSDKEARAKNADETLKQVEGTDGAKKSGLTDPDETAEKKRQADIEAARNDTTPGEVRSKLATRVRGVRGASTAVALVTLTCVVHALANSFHDSQAQREQQAARMAAETQTAADQQKFGDTKQQAVGAENGMWDNADNSPVYKSITGRPLSDQDQKDMASVASIKTPDSRFQSIISVVDTVLTGGQLSGTVPGLGTIHDQALNGLCDVLLNEYVQDAEALAEIAITVASAGSTEGIVAAIRAGVEGGLSLAGSVGLGELIGELIDSMVNDMSNMQFSGLETGPSRFDDAYVATDYSQNVGNRQITFGAPMDYAGTAAAQQQAMADLHKQNAESSFSQRYFALDNPFSLTSNLVAVMPTTMGGMAESIRGGLVSVISAIGSPQRLIGNVLGVFTARNHAFAASTSFRKDLYGVEEWGWTPEELARTDNDSSFDVESLIQTTEPKLDELNTKYGPCYDKGYILQTQRPSQCTKEFLTTDEAIHWRAYMAETYDAVHLAGGA
ncbi:MAG TPA: hypothetical protein VLI54_02710 [Bacillota bacterium]|nr:hypothetical protein [Bacillota bacterium]